MPDRVTRLTDEHRSIIWEAVSEFGDGDWAPEIGEAIDELVAERDRLKSRLTWLRRAYGALQQDRNAVSEDLAERRTYGPM